MTAADVITALELPVGARVDRRVPKTLLTENGAPTAADKRRINDGVDELWWVAALKPTTIAVPEYRDKVREYLEIAVLRLTLRPTAKAGRIAELVHRAVPYPVLLLTDAGDSTFASAAHKRWSQGEAGKTVLDNEVVTVEWNGSLDQSHRVAFHQALALGRQPHFTLLALYQGWMDTLLALEAARRTGRFEPPGSPDHAAARRVALRECARLDTEMARLRAAATKERQLARQVELNLELKRLEAARAAAVAEL